MWNIIVGILFIIGGASGEFVLVGTDSCGALVLVGIGLIVWGVIQVASAASDKQNSNQ